MSNKKDDGAEAIGWLIGIIFIVIAVAVIVAAVFTIGLGIVAVIVIAGTTWGLVIGVKNFSQVFYEAHKRLP